MHGKPCIIPAPPWSSPCTAGEGSEHTPQHGPVECLLWIKEHGILSCSSPAHMQLRMTNLHIHLTMQGIATV